MGNLDTSKGQNQGQTIQNPEQNPGQNSNVKNPRQGQDHGRQQQQGFDKNRQQQNARQDSSQKFSRSRFVTTLASEEGKIGYILAWLIGIPIPILIVIFLIRGCN